MPQQVATKAEFDKLINEAGPQQLVVVDFTATSCGPCQRVAPVFEQLAQDNGQVLFLKVDVDENSETSEAFNVKAMPTFLFLKGGKECTSRLQGADVESLKKLVKQHGGDNWTLAGEGHTLADGKESGASGAQTEKEKRLAALAARGL